MIPTVYDQLLKLQIMPNAWNDWRQYRSDLTDWILSQTEPDSTVLICGAGACNDYDLTQLALHFSKIYLLDLTAESMEQALTTQVSDISLHTKFECIEGDLVGITPTMYRRFSARLQTIVNLYGKDTNLSELSKIALEEMEASYEDRETPAHLFRENSVDYCLCFGLHSQLNCMYPWIFDAFCQALGKRDPAVMLKAKEFNDYFIPKFHEMLFPVARKGLLFGLEKTRLGIDGGVEGAYQGICDLERRIFDHINPLKDHTSLLWPFHPKEKIVYEMNLYHFKAT